MGNIKKTHLEHKVLKLLHIVLISVVLCVKSELLSFDFEAMIVLKQSLKSMPNGWNDPDPCKWAKVSCSSDGRITKILIKEQGLSGTLPPHLKNLTKLQRFEAMRNNLSGPLPSLSGLNQLQILRLNENQFTSVPADFFSDLSFLQAVSLDKNPFSAWEIPISLKDATGLQNFSANSANLTGTIPNLNWGNNFSSLKNLHLAFNNLEGGLPASFAG